MKRCNFSGISHEHLSCYHSTTICCSCESRNEANSSFPPSLFPPPHFLISSWPVVREAVRKHNLLGITLIIPSFGTFLHHSHHLLLAAIPPPAHVIMLALLMACCKRSREKAQLVGHHPLPAHNKLPTTGLKLSLDGLQYDVSLVWQYFLQYSNYIYCHRHHRVNYATSRTLSIYIPHHKKH